MPQSIDWNTKFNDLAYQEWLEYERTSCSNMPCMECIDRAMYRNMTEKNKQTAMKRGEYRGYVQSPSGQKRFLK